VGRYTFANTKASPVNVFGIFIAGNGQPGLLSTVDAA
jgi:hypothetical protein